MFMDVYGRYFYTQWNYKPTYNLDASSQTKWQSLGPTNVPDIWPKLLWMEEILHHLGWLKAYK